MSDADPADAAQPQVDWGALLAEVHARRDAARPEDFDWTPEGGDTLAAQVHTRRRELWAAPISWADVIMGSRALLDAQDSGAAGGTAHVVLSFDPRVDAAPMLLDFVARQIMLIWETPEAAQTPVGRWCARLRDGTLSRTRPYLRIPDALTCGYAMFVTPTTFIRAHLPKGRMRFERLPVFAQRAPDGWLMPVPSALAGSIA